MRILTFLSLVFFYGKIKCDCRFSFMTFCDDLSDLKDYDVEEWTELVVGNELGDLSRLRPVNFDSISLDRFEKLTTLIIVRQIRDIKRDTFSLEPDESKLEFLKLFGNDIKRLKANSFDSIRLRKLSLVNNSIEYIHREAFYNCEFGSIDLSYNNLEAIENGVFTEDNLLNATKEMVIRDNRLEAIEYGSFPSSLEILNLDRNNLRVINYNVFENLVNIQELTMSHNKISTLPGFKKFKNIRIIDVSYNDLISLNIQEFNDLTQLEVLDLSHNKIVYPHIFQKFNFPQRHPSLQISLAFNRLTHLILYGDSFRHHIVFLYGNPWNCKCWEILEKFMVDNNVKRSKCDLQYFGTGRVPYCINYPGNDCKECRVQNGNLSEKDLQGFLGLVESTKKYVNCNLVPKPL